MEDQNNQSVDRRDVLALTSDIVSAHVANNSVSMADLPNFIEQIFTTLSRLGSTSGDVAVVRPKPAVPVRRSINPDYIICLEDGQKLKMLKRHLRTAYNLSPVEYRERWGLPADYPMVAPNYAAQRRALAKKIGLGTKRGKRK